MYPVSTAFQEAVMRPSARRKIRARITAQSVFQFDESDTKSVSFSEMVSDDGALVLGGVYTAECKAVFSNANGKLSGVQFQGSQLVPEEGVEISPGTYEYVPYGVFEVQTVKYNNDLVELSGRCNLSKMERPFSDVPVVYPISCKNLMIMICQTCGVPLATSSFLNDSYMIQAPPEGEISCRDAVSYIAEIACSWARCDRMGRLELGWFKDPAPVFGEANLDGNIDTADGGTFGGRNTPTYDGGRFREETPDFTIPAGRIYNQSHDATPVYIYGVSFDSGDVSYLYGGNKYLVALSENPFLQHDIENVLRSIGNRLIGFTYVMASINWIGNPALQAGDMISVPTKTDTIFRTVATRSDYKYNGQALIMAGGQGELESQYRTKSQKQYSRIKAGLAEKQEQINAMDEAARALFSLFSGVTGGYKIDGDELGGEHKGRMYIAIDSPDIETAQQVWAYGAAGIFYFEHGIHNEPSTAWGSNGEFLARLITAEMIRTGVLRGTTGDMQWDLNNNRITFGNGSIQFDSSGGITITSGNIRTVMRAGVPFAIEVYEGGVWVRKSWAELDGMVTNKLSNRAGGTSASVGEIWMEGYINSGMRLTNNSAIDFLRILEGSPGHVGFLNRDEQIWLSNNGNTSMLGGTAGSAGGRIWVEGQTSATMLVGGSGTIEFWKGGSTYGTDGVRNGLTFRSGICITP